MNQNIQSAQPDAIADDDEISLLDLLIVIVQNIKLLVLGPLAIGVSALIISFLVTPTFTAKTSFLPPQQQQSAAAAIMQSLGAAAGFAGAAAGLKNPADQYVAIAKSRSVQDALIKRFDLQKRYDTEVMDDTRKVLDGKTKISSGKDGLITIEADDEVPAFAAELANAHVEELINLLNGLSLTEAQQRRVFFEQQLSQAKINLIKAEQALKLVGVNAGALKASPQAAVEVVARLQAEIAAGEVKLARMRSYLTESAPQFRQTLAELMALKEQLARTQREQPLLDSDASNDYISRYRDFKYQEALFEMFAKQYEIARADEAREGAVVQVVDQAVAPDRKSKPKKALIAVLATLASGFMLLLYVFMRQALVNAVKDPESAEKISFIANKLPKFLTRWGRA